MNIAGIFFAGLAALGLGLSASATAPAPVEIGVAWTSPSSSYVAGKSFEVSVVYTAGSDVANLATWRLNAAAFSVNGKPLGKRGKGVLPMAEGSKLSYTFDLGPALADAHIRKAFTLSCDGGPSKELKFYKPAPEGLDFIDPSKLSNDDLADYKVLLATNRGDMLVGMSPELAPNHVRNFLDLSYTGFYDGVQFHRVMPGFMIQGGDPNTKDLSKKRLWGTGNGPRQLGDEFSKTAQHVRGVLSMANSGFPDSASCQFFIMHATYPSLNGKYSIFGKLESGFDTLDAIVTTRTEPTAPGTTPIEPQKILSATVLYSPAK